MKHMTPTHNAVIPAQVRYADIPDGAKLLYGEITSMRDISGYCYAENAYFANLYKVDIKTIKRWLYALTEIKEVSVPRPEELTTEQLFETGDSVQAIYICNWRKLDKNVPDSPGIGKLTYSKLFEVFWEEYPSRRKDDKKGTYLKFNKLEEIEQKMLIEDIKRRKVEHYDWIKEEGEYVPAPSVYLNREQYLIPIKKKIIITNAPRVHTM